jgi:hypothetical protein
MEAECDPVRSGDVRRRGVKRSTCPILSHWAPAEMRPVEQGDGK